MEKIEVTLELCAEHFEFLAKMLRWETMCPVVDGEKKGAVPTWKLAIHEAELAAKMIREKLKEIRHEIQP